MHKTLEANSFSPTNVSLTMQSFPSQDKSPSSPLFLDDDGNANIRAHVREYTGITQLDWSDDGAAEVGLLEAN